MIRKVDSTLRKQFASPCFVSLLSVTEPAPRNVS